MNPCQICGLHLRDQYNLERHMMRKHEKNIKEEEESEEEESDDEEEEEEMDQSESVHDKKLGVKRPRDIFDDNDSESEKSDNDDDDDDDDDVDEQELITEKIIDDVYNEFEEDRQELIDQLQSNGRDDADEEAHRLLVDKYRKAFRGKMTHYFLTMDKLRKERIYDMVMDTAKELRLEGLGREESIRSAVSKRKHKLNEFIPDELEDVDNSKEETDD